MTREPTAASTVEDADLTGGRRARPPLAALRQAARPRPAPPAQERCDMCATPLAAEHPHLVDLDTRALMCSCRACYLLFADEDAQQRYRAVPDRFLTFPGVDLDGPGWDELQIPVGLTFLFHNSALGRMVAFYPGPAGATESELPLVAWDRIVGRYPELGLLRPDVEALLIRRDGGSCHLVPIDACYELTGRLRTVWHGFDGGQQAREVLDAFFARVRARSRPVVAP